MRIPDAHRRRKRTAGPWVLDGLLAVVAAGAGVATLATVLPFDPGSPRAWAAYLLVLAHTLPIAVRRRWPLGVLAVGLATGAAFAALGLNLAALNFAVLVYVYTVAAHRPRRASLAGLAATEALLVLVWLARPRALGDGGTLVLDGLIMAAGWWLGDGAGRRQEAVVTARELHDVVAHSMSIIAVQSGVGVHVLDSQPEEARKALVAVETTSRQALVEMRRLLGVLRQEAEPRGSLAPAPGLAEVEALAALCGGTLEAGPLPGGGFRIAASLPVEELG
jgi:signal transduction histidine kinase